MRVSRSPGRGCRSSGLRPAQRRRPAADRIRSFTLPDLLHLRKSPALQRGEFVPLHQTGEALAYLRRSTQESILVALNFKDRWIDLESTEAAGGKLLLSNRGGSPPEFVNGNLRLAPCEARLLRMS
jgi:hypothetical protein